MKSFFLTIVVGFWIQIDLIMFSCVKEGILLLFFLELFQN